MIVRGLVIILTIFVFEFNCLNLNGKKYIISQPQERNGTSIRTVYSKDGPPKPWVARSIYNKTYLKSGWDTFDIETNPEIDDKDQAFLAGYLEGVETQAAIYDHFYNTITSVCNNDTKLCQRVQDYLDTNTQWIKEMVIQHAASDIYWRQVNLFYQQMFGMMLGYNSVAPTGKKLDVKDIMWMNFNWDFRDLVSAFKNETNKVLQGNGHCSALIKLLPRQSDIFVAHNTWDGYETMRRIIKRYTLRYKQVAATSLSFSGYPGTLASGDDFYIISSGLVIQETTNDLNNASLWSLLKPVGQVLEVVRVAVANRLADGGQSWTKIFSQYNSGTYNNQWMIVDMKKFTPGLPVKPGLLWIAEQTPGYIRREDKTDVLRSQGYWASYNVPYFPDVFELMGNQQLVKQYGDFFTHDKSPRALIFKRDQAKVTNLDSLMLLMRSNDFEHDPLSRCNCSPPYSSFNTIAARSDLNPINGSYPFPALRHRPYGATDAKVTSYRMSKSLSMLAVSGPTTGAHLPPFQWSKSDFNLRTRHRGHPDIFRFQPVLISWPHCS